MGGGGGVCSGDGADGATAALVLHGSPPLHHLPPLQLAADPPADSLQVQTAVKLPRAQGDAATQ